MLDVKHGSLDGSFFLAKIKSREVFLVYSEAYAQVKSYFYFNKTTLKDFQWSEWPDLKKYSIGIQRGFKYGAEFSDAIKNESLNIIATNDISQIIRMSLVNRIDLFVTTPLRYSIMEKEYPQFKGKFSFFSGRPVNTGLYYLALSKKSKFLGSLPVINQAIKSLKANRTFRDIIDNQK